MQDGQEEQPPALPSDCGDTEQTAALSADAPPEILSADLSHLALDLAAWGVEDPNNLVWLNQPPGPAMNEAKTLLKSLDALDKTGGLTPHGKALRSLFLPPRVANMLIKAAQYGDLEKAALLSVVMSERGLGGNSADLEQRCERTRSENGARAQSAKKLAQRLIKNTMAPGLSSRSKPVGEDLSHGAILSFAWPGRIAHRTGQSPSGAIRFRLANGSGAEIEAEHALAQSPWLVVADLAGRAGAARILSAAAISQKDIERLHFDLIKTIENVVFDPENGKVKARAIRVLGTLKLSQTTIANPAAAMIERALLDGVVKYGLQLLQLDDTQNSLRRRLQFLHEKDVENWPDVDDDVLLDKLDEWLSPIIAGKDKVADISPTVLDTGLKMLVPWEQHGMIDRLAPRYLELGNNEKIQLRYQAGDIVLSARIPQILRH